MRSCGRFTIDVAQTAEVFVGVQWGRTATPNATRMSKAKVRRPTTLRKGWVKRPHPMAKIRTGIRCSQRKRGRGR